MAFTVTIVEYPRVFLAGMRVESNMMNAAVDCSALWQKFGPRMHELSGAGKGESYGVSMSTDPRSGRFEYWAAKEIDPKQPVPGDMERLTIQPGYYASCSVSSLAQIAPAFNFLYTGWLEENGEYVLDMLGVCFELYAADWKANDPFTVYTQLRRQ